MSDELSEFLEMMPDAPWLEQANCADLPPEELDKFFVEAGRTISQSTLELCRRCPVRRECLEHAYDVEAAAGYFAGMSPGQRRSMTFEQALVYIENDPPRRGRVRKGGTGRDVSR